MRLLRKVAAATSAAMVMAASGPIVAQADSTPTVYNTPGGQISGGRLWNTTCEKYSTNVVRCRANIWATQVQYRNGRFVKTTGWTFNNLSYLPSPRASWAGNNLARNNSSWTSGGRTWKTECDTATTGRGGCRSYVWTKKVVAIKSGSGYRYENRRQWVFNNLVLFSSSAVPAVNKVPAWIIDQSRLDFTGLGPLQVGVPMEDLERLGYVRGEFDACQFYIPSTSLSNRGIHVNHDAGQRAAEVTVSEPGVRTREGAQVGMRLADVRDIYGAAVELEVKRGITDVEAAVVQKDDDELVFFSSFNQGSTMDDSDVITMIVAREYSDWFGGDC